MLAVTTVNLRQERSTHYSPQRLHAFSVEPLHLKTHLHGIFFNAMVLVIAKSKV